MLQKQSEEALRNRLAAIDRERLTELFVQLARDRPELADWAALKIDPHTVSQEVRNRIAQQQELAKAARRKRFLAQDVRLLLSGHEPQLAEKLLVSRAQELDGSDFALLSLLCDEAEKVQAWLIALIVRRAMLQNILDTSRTNAYPVAARHFIEMRRLAALITDFKGLHTQAQFEAAVHEAHEGKASFWKLADPQAAQAAAQANTPPAADL